MTTLKEVKLVCPVCGHEFSSQIVVQTNSFGGKRTDFHERAAGEQPLPHLVHACMGCGYAGAEDDFGEEVEVWCEVRNFVRKEIKPLFEYEGVTGAAKYEATAKIGELQGLTSKGVADLLLRAAWCCVNDGDTEAERYYRLLSAKKFEESLATYEEIPPEERAVITYLVGELWRRIGDGVTALFWFNMVEDEVLDPEDQKWVIMAARQQSSNEPREWFG